MNVTKEEDKKWRDLAENNIQIGLATLICVGDNRWAIPGGGEIVGFKRARNIAYKMDLEMRGVKA